MTRKVPGSGMSEADAEIARACPWSEMSTDPALWGDGSLSPTFGYLCTHPHRPSSFCRFAECVLKSKS